MGSARRLKCAALPLSSLISVLVLSLVSSAHGQAFSYDYRSGNPTRPLLSPDEDFPSAFPGLSDNFLNQPPISSMPDTFVPRPQPVPDLGSHQGAQPASQEILQEEFINLFMPGSGSDSDYVTPGFSKPSRCPVHQEDMNLIKSMCSHSEFFYGMNPKHMTAVGMMKAVLMAANDAEDVICKAKFLKNTGQVNPHVWLRGLMGAVLSRADMQGLQRPSLVEMMPSMMVNSVVLDEARRIADLPRHARGDGCVVVDGSVGRDNGIENILWYFREDVMVNSHHWYWHLINPFMPMTTPVFPIRPDRRGELFYYVHHSMLARYHAERLSNGLRKVDPLKIFEGTVVQQHYFPHLDESNSGNRWTARPPNRRVSDIRDTRNPNQTVVSVVRDREIRQQRIIDAINSGSFMSSDGRAISLLNTRGIDLVGDVVEASIWSVNPGFYGRFGVHNEGHLILGLIQDPQGTRGLPPGVMADAATAMRDPIFYQYHSVPIESLFDKHKHSLTPYTPTGGEFPLIWPGVTITKANIVSRSISNGQPHLNDLTTFWNHASYNLAGGLDFNRTATSPIEVCLRHLDHDPFEYVIDFELDQFVSSKLATVRIFMAPHLNEDGRPYTMVEQRYVFFALDSFTVRVIPGKNRILRKSLDSTLTVPWPQRLDEHNRGLGAESNTLYCGCGWPQHLLIPKGKPEGMLFDIFIMLTNGEEDAVPQLPVPANTPPNSCKPAPIYCGIPNQLYPDSRPMNYPFDRLPYSVQDVRGSPYGERVVGGPRRVRNLAEFVNGIPNIATFQVRVTHSGL